MIYNEANVSEEESFQFLLSYYISGSPFAASIFPLIIPYAREQKLQSHCCYHQYLYDHGE